MDNLIEFNKKFSQILAWVAGTLLVLASSYVSLDVLARKIFNYSFNGADELAGYSLAISLTFGLSYALFQRAHIRIDLVAAKMPFRIRAALDIVAMAAFASFIAAVAYYAALKFGDTYTHSSRSVTPLQTPLVIPQGLWLFGLLFCLFCAICLIISACMKLAKKDYEGFEALVGLKSIDEEISDEIGTAPQSKMSQEDRNNAKNSIGEQK